MCYAAFVRSDYAHANIVSIDVSAAMEMPGAIGVITPDEVLPHVNPVRPAAPGSSEYARPYDRFPVPPGKVTFVGDPIVAVAASTPHAAQDMAEAVVVEYEPLPVVGGVEQAMAPDAPVIHAGMDDNIVFHREFGDGDVEGAFSRASLVLEKTFHFPRQTGVPLEARGVIASYDSGQDRLTLWASCRSPHLVKTTVSNVMRLPQHSVRVISGDVGGEFGIKGAAYPESIILSFLSRKVERPVKWVEDRMESLMACGHAHEMVVDVSVAADNDGKVHGVRARVLVDQGAHTLGPTSAGLEPMTTGQSIVGPYRIDNFECNSYGVLTNKCPGAAYRGVGTVQGVFVIERVMDMLADELGLDPVDVRMKNFIQPQDQPFNTSAGRLYDSGDYPDTLAKLLEVSSYQHLREEQAEARSRGEQVGIGICCFVEHSSTGSQDYIKRGVYGLPAFDSATIRVDAGGNVLAAVSAKSTGQSHDSVFAILVARELGVPYETVKILEGDTDATPFGSGTGVSRSAVSTGGAIRLAAQDIRRKATEIARFILETENEELQVEDGQIFDPEDPTKTVSFAAVAAAAHDASRIVSLPRNIERGLQSTRTFDPPHQTFGHGAHLAVTRIDPETGMVKVEQYFCVEDCGTIIDHVIVDGQVVGAVALGIGNALHEELVYSDDGQLLTGTFMDYLVPTAPDVPEIQTLHTETPSPFTQGGVKGVGEAGTVGAFTAVGNAVADALLPLGVEVTEPPIGPRRVWEMIQKGNK
jgi:carbon-monoxide dehydrogenase large subunit